MGQSGSGGQFARTIRFRDRNEVELQKYDPANVNEFGQVNQIAANEQLIGVYAALGDKDYFSNFGFIIRVNDEANNNYNI